MLNVPPDLKHIFLASFWLLLRIFVRRYYNLLQFIMVGKWPSTYCTNLKFLVQKSRFSILNAGPENQKFNFLEAKKHAIDIAALWGLFTCAKAIAFRVIFFKRMIVRVCTQEMATIIINANAFWHCFFYSFLFSLTCHSLVMLITKITLNGVLLPRRIPYTIPLASALEYMHVGEKSTERSPFARVARRCVDCIPFEWCECALAIYSAINRRIV